MAARLLVAFLPLASAGLRSYFAKLPFNARDPPAHTTDISVGVYFEHLFKVNQKEHTFDADFWLVYKWHDGRNFSHLFFGDDGNYLDHVEVEELTCDDGHGSGHGSSGSGGHRRLSTTSATELRGRALGSSSGSSGGSSITSSGASHGARHFLELGQADLEAMWAPDLHIRNAHGDTKTHAVLIRVYEDGTVEQMALTFAVLELHHPFYASYPFDHQLLTVIIESEAHTTLQLTVSKLDNFSGVNFELTSEWPGWVMPSADSIHAFVATVAPHYAHIVGNEHRCERRGQYHLEITVGRVLGTTVTNEFMPLILLIMLTWTAFYINVKVLMPRVAVGFISFLTLSNMAASFTAALPAVSYDTWLNVFFIAHRFFVLVTLLETAACVWVTDHLSTRVGLKLDQFARVAMPIAYFAMLLLLFIGGSTGVDDHAAYESKLGTLAIIAYLIVASVVIAGILRVLLAYRALKHELNNEPLSAHARSIDLKPLDEKEVRILFDSFDTNGNKVITFDEVLARVERTCPALQNAEPSSKAALVETLKKKPTFSQQLTLPKFLAAHKAILDELDFFVTVLLDPDMVAYGSNAPEKKQPASKAAAVPSYAASYAPKSQLEA